MKERFWNILVLVLAIFLVSCGKDINSITLKDAAEAIEKNLGINVYMLSDDSDDCLKYQIRRFAKEINNNTESTLADMKKEIKKNGIDRIEVNRTQNGGKRKGEVHWLQMYNCFWTKYWGKWESGRCDFQVEKILANFDKINTY